MSVRSMARVWAESSHAGTELLMLLAIADFADDDGRAYPAVATLAAKCRMTPRNANYILAVLQESGELEVRANQGPRGTNRYRIVFEAMAPAAESTHTNRPRGMQSDAGVKSSAGVKCISQTPAKDFTPPLQPTSDEPSLNHHEPSVPCAAVTTGDLFAKFWSAYPRKVGKDAASKAFAKRRPTPALLDLMLTAISRQRETEQWQRNRGQFIPHPSTWLNEGRWQDEDDESCAADTAIGLGGASVLHADDSFGAAA